MTVLQQKGKHDDAMAIAIKRMLQKVSEYDQEEPQYCRPTPGTVRKSHKAFTVKIYPKDMEGKATSSLFLVNLFAKLEMP